MAEASVEIPAGLAGRIRDSAVLLFEAAAEGLHLALRAYAWPDGPAEDVRRQRERVVRLDALLVQMGWWAEPTLPAGREAMELRGASEILRDVLYGALMDAGERLPLECGGRGCAAGQADTVQAAEEVIALDRLLGEVRPA